jgi:hypothetical protein
MDEFSFVKNEEWLKPFLTKLKEYYSDNTDRLTTQEATDFAISNVNSVFRKRCCLFHLTVASQWKECVSKEYQSKYDKTEKFDNGNYRRSKGFGNRYVPNMKKFNPKFYEEKYKDVLLLAEYSYNYLYFSIEIETILTTPLSDYTRFNRYVNKPDKMFLLNFRFIHPQYNANYIDAVLTTYNLKNVY